MVNLGQVDWFESIPGTRIGQKEKAMLRKLTFLTLLVASVCYADPNILNTKDKVTLRGVFSFEKFPNCISDAEFLTLDRPINIGKDNYGGPVTNVKRIQLAFRGKAWLSRRNEHRRLKITGKLFYPKTDCDRTQILLRVYEVTRLDSKSQK